MNDIWHRFQQIKQHSLTFATEGSETANDILKGAGRINGTANKGFMVSLSNFLSRLNAVAFYDDITRSIAELYSPFEERVDAFLLELDALDAAEKRIKNEIQSNQCSLN